MNGFLCRCGLIFRDPTTHRAGERHEVWGEPVVQDYLETSCPNCGRDDFDEIVLCQFCHDRGELVEATEHELCSAHAEQQHGPKCSVCRERGEDLIYGKHPACLEKQADEVRRTGLLAGSRDLAKPVREFIRSIS